MKLDSVNLHSMVVNKTVEVLSAFANAIEARDEYTKRHSTKVADLSYRIARHLALPERQIQRLYWAAIVHDVGKIGVPEDILLKTASLTDEEYKLLQQHPKIGAKILEPVGSFKNLIPAVYHHHERFDGIGYPDRLSGQKIPLMSRILAVADSYDAMTSDRCYRSRLPHYQVLEEFRVNRGTQFDPEVTDVLLMVAESGELDSELESIEYMI